MNKAIVVEEISDIASVLSDIRSELHMRVTMLRENQYPKAADELEALLDCPHSLMGFSERLMLASFNLNAEVKP